jgi:hypothetical protein
MPKKSLKPAPQTDDAQDTHGKSSKFGQLIGDAFAVAVFNLIKSHVTTRYPQYTVTDAKKLLRLQMMGGTQRQIDNIIRSGEEGDPVALFETKWLKDARHHNDKGAWILQLREISKAYPTIRGTVAILAGYWTEGVALMFESEGRVRMVQVAKDDEIYQTLQPSLDTHLRQAGLAPLQLDAVQIRN